MIDLRSALGIPWQGSFPHPTLVMGIVNVTPNSFQSEGRHQDPTFAVYHALRLIDEGADILDIGGESTRPGAPPVSLEDEQKRVLPVIEGIRARSSVPVSVDTRKAPVAREALELGAVMVNDVSAGRFDPAMFETAAAANAFICLMHGPVDTENMAWSTDETAGTGDIVSEVSAFLRERAGAAERAGVSTDRIIIDPGFGFGKTVAENLSLIRELGVLAELDYPVLIGVSRKSTVGRILGDVPPEERVEGSIALALMAVERGAAVIRTHDVQATVRAIRALDAALGA